MCAKVPLTSNIGNETFEPLYRSNDNFSTSKFDLMAHIIEN